MFSAGIQGRKGYFYPMRKRDFAIWFILILFLSSCQPSTEQFTKLAEDGCACYQEVINASRYSESTVKFKECNVEEGLDAFNLELSKFLEKHKGFERGNLAPVQGKLMACQKAASDYLEQINGARTAEHTAWEEDRDYKSDGSSIVGKWTIDYIGASEIADWANNSGFTFYEDGRFEQRLHDKNRSGTYKLSEDGKTLDLVPEKGKGSPKTLDVFEISEKYFSYAEANVNTGKVRMKRD